MGFVMVLNLNVRCIHQIGFILKISLRANKSNINFASRPPRTVYYGCKCEISFIMFPSPPGCQQHWTYTPLSEHFSLALSFPQRNCFNIILEKSSLFLMPRLFGVMGVQTFSYFQNYGSDRLVAKIVVSTLLSY